MIETTGTNGPVEHTNVIDFEIDEMAKAGIHMGHAKTKNNPGMVPYIFGIRNTIAILDLVKTKEKLNIALTHIRDVVGRGGVVLLVGTRPAARKIIHEVAEKTHMPYFTERWIGGALTNFKVISKRVEYMETLEREKAGGDFEKYTKRERMKKEEEIVRLRRFFDGLRNLKRLPDLLFVVDVTHDDTAVREANRLHIPVVALVDTNSDPRGVQYPIPSNDDALLAVRYMVTKIGAVIEEGQKQAQTGGIEDRVV